MSIRECDPPEVGWGGIRHIETVIINLKVNIGGDCQPQTTREYDDSAVFLTAKTCIFNSSTPF